MHHCQHLAHNPEDVLKFLVFHHLANYMIEREKEFFKGMFFLEPSGPCFESQLTLWEAYLSQPQFTLPSSEYSTFSFHNCETNILIL